MHYAKISVSDRIRGRCDSAELCGESASAEDAMEKECAGSMRYATANGKKPPKPSSTGAICTESRLSNRLDSL